MNLDEVKELLIARIIFYLEPHLEKLHNYYIESEGAKIELFGATDDTKKGQFLMVRIVISEEWKKIYVSNINLPEFLRHQGIGKKMVKVIYKAATEFQYEVFIALMTDSFFENMKKRGAVECEKSHMLKIVDRTMLD